MPRNEETSARMRAESRAAILEAARKLFAEVGFFKCTVSDVAREAGMSQGNVYWYFKSKDEILKAILAEGFESIEAMTAAVARLESDPREQIEMLIEQSVVLYKKQRYFITILLSLFAQGGAGYMAEMGFDMRVIGQSYHANLIPVFTRAREQGLVADLDPNIHVMHFFGLINGLMLTYGDDWMALPPEIFRFTVLRLLGVPGIP